MEKSKKKKKEKEKMEMVFFFYLWDVGWVELKHRERIPPLSRTHKAENKSLFRKGSLGEGGFRRLAVVFLVLLCRKVVSRWKVFESEKRFPSRYPSPAWVVRHDLHLPQCLRAGCIGLVRPCGVPEVNIELIFV